MCCGRRNNNKTNFWAVAQQVLSRPVATSSVNTGEPLGPPPAYEHVEHQSTKLGKNKDASTTALVEKHNPSSIRGVPQNTSVDPLVDSSLNNTSPHAIKSTCQSRCAAKRERKNEQRQLKREYRQEKRELRAEYRNEKKEMRKSSVNSLLNVPIPSEVAFELKLDLQACEDQDQEQVKRAYKDFLHLQREKEAQEKAAYPLLREQMDKQETEEAAKKEERAYTDSLVKARLDELGYSQHGIELFLDPEKAEREKKK